MAREDTLSILRADLAELLAEQDVPYGAACTITDKFIECLRKKYGGDRLLVPKIDRTKRDAAILADWRARYTPDEIAARNDVSRGTVYRIINRRNQREPGGRDADFGSDEWRL